jgi:hypothetical protein
MVIKHIMKNIHLLPTDKRSRLGLHNEVLDYAPLFGFELFDKSKNFRHNPASIYITNDEKIKEGDWVYCNREGFEPVLKQKVNTMGVNNDPSMKKIILTTDADLIKDGVQSIDDEFLEWFVKNPSCEEVEIENWYNKYLSCCRSKEECYCNKKRIIIPKEEHPNQIKCYCGHTSYCDCIPLDEAKQETLEEFALKNSKYTNHSNINHSKEEAIILGAKWQQEDILELLKVNGYEDEPIFDLITEQFKKNI